MPPAPDLGGTGKLSVFMLFAKRPQAQAVLTKAQDALNRRLRFELEHRGCEATSTPYLTFSEVPLSDTQPVQLVWCLRATVPYVRLPTITLEDHIDHAPT